MAKNKNFDDADSWIQTIVNRIFDKRTKNEYFTKYFPAIVSSVGTGVASIKLPTDMAQVIPNIKIRHGVTVSVGDTVYIMAINRSNNNWFIDYNPSQV